MGLSDFGTQAIKKMEEKSLFQNFLRPKHPKYLIKSLDILIDLAHCSYDLIDDVLKIATTPIVVSHTG